MIRISNAGLAMLVGTTLFLRGGGLPAEPARLDRWPLDAPPWRSARGIAPLSAQGAVPTTGLRGDAAHVGESLRAAGLVYPVLGPGFSQGFRFDQGTLRFAFRPDWSTLAGGAGQTVVLAEVIASKAPARGFRWQVNGDRTRVEWLEIEGEEETLLADGPIAWQSGRWVLLTAVYGGPARIALYVNGTRISSSGDDIRDPSLPNPGSFDPVRLRIGSDEDGQRRARGSFDEVELFNVPFSALAVEADLTAGLWVEPQEDSAALHLRWRARPEISFRVRRRAAGASAWTVLATNWTSWAYTDTQVTPGQRYEYVINDEKSGARDAFRYLPAGLNLDAVPNQGRVLLLVDRTLARNLSRELDQLHQDLLAEGWQPERQLAPRHLDREWSHNPPLIEQVRRQVADTYAQPGSPLRALYLIGHVVVPHSGYYRPDGHAARPFPADGYYGDVKRGTNDWTDVRNYRSGPLKLSGPPPVPNEAGDGVFDQNSYPSAVEVAVGRVDFANLPTFTENPPSGARRVSEIELTRRYLEKAHRYRRGQLRFPARVTFHHPPPTLPGPLAAAQLPLRNARSWFGDAPWLVENVDPFRAGRARRYLLASVAGYGGYAHVGGAPEGRWTTADLAQPRLAPQVAIHFIDGSYLGDFNLVSRPVRNTFIRALLAQPNSGLVAIWDRINQSSVSLQALGLGDPLGPAWWSHPSNTDLSNGSGYLIGNVHLALLGDPTLRFPVLPPVQNLQANAAGNRVTLRWAATLNPDVRYTVYRTKDPATEAFVPLTVTPVQESEIVDLHPPPGGAVYLVRPTQLTRTGCGTFHDLGPGQLIEVR